MDNFVYDTPTKVYFGKNEEENVGTYVAALGATKVLVHYGSGSAKKSGLLDKVTAALDAKKISWVELGVKKEDLEVLALKCSRGKTRTLAGYRQLGYQEMLDIYSMAW